MPLILPSPERREYFRKINRLLTTYRDSNTPDSLTMACKLMLEDAGFLAHIKVTPALRRELKTPGDLMNLSWGFLYYFLYQRDYVAGALILWGPETFTPEPECAQAVWDSLFNDRMIGILGGGGLGKTYSPSAWLLLDWVLDPEWTRLQVASNSEDHLKKNLFGDIIRLHSGSSLRLPGTADSESISLDKKSGMGIFTLTIPGGPNAKGKIKGAHTKPRPQHPLFGKRSRIRILVDEAQEVAQNIFTELPNRFSTVAPGDFEHIKVLVCANPKDVFSPFGQAMKPVGGFDKLQDGQTKWISDEGWSVVSLNAMAHENVRERRVIYPGFVTYEGVELWVRKCHGDDQHPDMFTYVYGRFPPSGTLSSLIPQRHLLASEGEWIFDSLTVPFAACDPAFTGDLPTLATGRAGRATGWVRINGERVNLEEPRMAIQVDSVVILPRGDTQELADEIMSRLKQLGIKPESYAQDKTGNGLGVHDVIRRQWEKKVGPLRDGEAVADIVGINYAQSPTETLIADEDTQPPSELYDRIASELWFAAGKLFEYDVIRMGRGVDARTYEELSSRKGGSKAGLGKKQTVEGKDAYKLRTGSSSPDRADCTLMLIHVARISTPNLIPKAKDTKVDPMPDVSWGGGMILEMGGCQISGFDGAKAMGMRD
jgi:hypothetical protein